MLHHEYIRRPGNEINESSGQTIAFEKDVDGVVIVVEQVRRGRGELAFFNMYINKRRE